MNESIADMLANTADWSEKVCEGIIGLVRELEDRFDGQKDSIWEHLVVIQDSINKARQP